MLKLQRKIHKYAWEKFVFMDILLYQTCLLTRWRRRNVTATNFKNWLLHVFLRLLAITVISSKAYIPSYLINCFIKKQTTGNEAEEQGFGLEHLQSEIQMVVLSKEGRALDWEVQLGATSKNKFMKSVHREWTGTWDRALRNSVVVGGTGGGARER